MASINVRPTNTDNKTTRVEVVRALARLENTALKCVSACNFDPVSGVIGIQF